MNSLDKDSDVYTIATVAKKRPLMKTWRATLKDVQLIAALASKLGVSEADILRLGLRCLADRELGSLQRVG